MPRACSATFAFVLVGCNAGNNDLGPTTPPANAQCDLAGFTPDQPVPNNANLNACMPTSAGMCDCSGYFGTSFFPGTYDFDKTKATGTCYVLCDLSTPPLECPPSGEQAIPTPDDGCESCYGQDTFQGLLGETKGNRYAWPGCAYIAETVGTLIGTPGRDPISGFEGDDDYNFNVCVLPGTSVVNQGFDSEMRKELRNSQTYGGTVGAYDDAPVPRMHSEVQMCHLFDGSMVHGGNPPLIHSFRPQAGETISVAGDWVVDVGHSDNDAEWTEIHETRALAVTRPGIFPHTFFGEFSAFFAAPSNQSDVLVLDIFIPPDPDPTMTKLTCGMAPVSIIPDCGVPSSVSAFPPVAMMAEGNAFCRIQFQRLSGGPFVDFGCQKQCGGDDFTSYNSNNQTACGPNDAIFAGAIRATWSDPADLWLCHSCACADPSVPGATIIAPVQGCAHAADPATACNQVCGGQICGGAPACNIGTCVPSGNDAEVIAQATCDPSVPQPATRVSPSGDYRVTLLPSSFVLFSGSGTSIFKPVTGTFHINFPPDSCTVGSTLDFADTDLTIPDFDLNGHSVTGGRLVPAGRFFGQFADCTSFNIPAGEFSFGARAVIDGKLKGVNIVNQQTLPGTIDRATGEFTLEINATDPGTGNSAFGLLRGMIDDRPPVADPGPSRAVQCSSQNGTPVTLDASGSYDPDAGDSISHYQWFDHLGGGVGNTAQINITLPYGESAFELHVYDGELGSGKAPVTIDVIDTLPPTLDLLPSAFCLWPPNHKRLHFHMGTDFQANAIDTCDPNPTVKIISVASSEPDSGLGDGDMSGDVAWTDTDFCVRSERTAVGSGRTYTVTLQAQDSAGNVTSTTLLVDVPHDKLAGCGRVGTVIAEGAPCQ